MAVSSIGTLFKGKVRVTASVVSGIRIEVYLVLLLEHLFNHLTKGCDNGQQHTSLQQECVCQYDVILASLTYATLVTCQIRTSLNACWGKHLQFQNVDISCSPETIDNGIVNCHEMT